MLSRERNTGFPACHPWNPYRDNKQDFPTICCTLLVPSRKPFYLTLRADSWHRSECEGLKALHEWEMELGKMHGWGWKETGHQFSEMLSLLCCFCSTSSSHACSLSLTSFPPYQLFSQLQDEGNPTKINFPLLMQHSSFFRVLSGLPWPILATLWESSNSFLQFFLLPWVPIQISTNDRVWDLWETLRNQQKDENYRVRGTNSHFSFWKTRGQQDNHSR